MTATLEERRLAAIHDLDRAIARHPESSFADFLGAVRIADAHGEGATMAFEPWPHLMERARAWERGDSEIVLKARQLGISWLLASYMVWRARKPGTTVLGLSQGEDEAYELVAKCHQVGEGLVRWERDSAGELDIAGGGRIIALPATQKAGRGYTASLVVADEAAFHPWAAQNYAAYRPTLDGGGQLLMVSTANGASGFFHDLWIESEAGNTGFGAVFVPWYARPGRDAAWLDRERAAFSGLPGEFAAEYPATPQEAFIAHSGLVYGIDDQGLAIFDRRRNVGVMPIPWSQCKWRLGGVDPGGRDPTAAYAIGVSPDDRVYVHRELYRRGAVGALDIGDWLKSHHDRARFNLVLNDPSNTTMATDLGMLGLPAMAANNDKRARISAMTLLLREGRLIIDPSCTNLLAEIDTYWWAERNAAGSGGTNALATRTPGWHHADGLDAVGYAALALLNGVVQDGETTRIPVRQQMAQSQPRREQPMTPHEQLQARRAPQGQLMRRRPG